MSGHPLDLTKIDIRPYSESAVVNRFCCGKTALDRFLKNKAKKAIRRLEMRVFCAHLENSENVLGYYALQVGSDSVAEIAEIFEFNKNKHYLQSYTAFPRSI